MHVVLWDTRERDVAKDFAGGIGIGQYHGFGGFRGRVIRHMFKRDRRPVAMNFAYMAAIFQKLGHTVEYCEDEAAVGADLYVFNPSLITLDLEIAAIQKVLERNPRTKILITGLVAFAVPEAFKDLDVTVVRGECEMLLWKLDEVLNSTKRVVDVGSVRELDHLPFPDWSLFGPSKFRIGYDFTRFPTGLIQQSRGCTFTCNYCPYIIVENATRFRTPESVFEELRHGMKTYGFKSFKFRDPLFGLDRKRVVRLAELIGKLPKKIEFSIESRIDLLRPETLKMLRAVGLTAITVGIETPDEGTLKQYKRAPIKDDKQRDFVTICRGLGIRTVAGFMIGFPDDNVDSIRGVLHYAKAVNPTYANFNVVTPYPGTEFYNEVKDQIAEFDLTKYNVYTPLMKYKHLTHEQVQFWHSKCFMRYFFRWEWLTSNAHMLWPKLQLLGVGRKYAAQANALLGAQKPAAATATATTSKLGSLPVIDTPRELRKDQAHCHTGGDKAAEPTPKKKSA
jgi:anaerobic magnesium-protoporphyrin IX monomethyl ester cyclase